MEIRNPSIEILEITPNILQMIEKAGRTCYKSESKITKNSAEIFVRGIIKRGHESVIEHGNITVKIICDRGVSHEIVRHRLASYSQESTRYVNYKEGIEVIEPCFWNFEIEDGHIKDNNATKYATWNDAMQYAEACYKDLIKLGATPQEARTVLPNSLKTELVMTMNLREWRHFLKLRTSKVSHPQIREIAMMILDKFKEILPIVFAELKG